MINKAMPSKAPLMSQEMLSRLALSPPQSPRQSDVSFTSGGSIGKGPGAAGRSSASSVPTTMSPCGTAALVPYISTSTISMPRSSHASTERPCSPTNSVSSSSSQESSSGSLTSTSTVSTVQPFEEDEEFSNQLRSNVISTNPTNSNLFNSNPHYHCTHKNMNNDNIYQFTKSSPSTPVSHLYQSNYQNENCRPNANQINYHSRERVRPRSQPHHNLRSLSSQNKLEEHQSSRPVSHPSEPSRPHSQPSQPLLLEPLSVGRLPKARVFVHREPRTPASRCISDLARAPPRYSSSRSSSTSSQRDSNLHHPHNRRHRAVPPSTRLHTDLAEATAYLSADHEFYTPWMPPRDELQDWSCTDKARYEDDDEEGSSSYASSSFAGEDDEDDENESESLHEQKKRSTSTMKVRNSNNDQEGGVLNLTNDQKWATSLRNLAGMASRGKDRAPPCIRGSVLEVQPPSLYERFGLAGLANNKKVRSISHADEPPKIRRPRAKTDGLGDRHQAVPHSNMPSHYNIPIRAAAATPGGMGRNFGACGTVHESGRKDEYVGFLIDSAPQQKRPRRWLRFFRKSRQQAV